MADQMVFQAQQFINNTYKDVSGIPTVEENGKTSWAVMYALTRALQYELGITSLSNSFGPGTLSALRSKFPEINNQTELPANIVKIIQSGLWCKGYPATGMTSGVDGDFSSTVSSSIDKLQADMGVASAFPSGTVTPKLFKGLLTMDAYVKTIGGSDTVRSIEQWFNGRYINRADYFIIPCDGHYSRDVQKALMLAIQYELGMADGVANGVFGPGTREGLRSHPLSVGSTGVWVRLFSAAMVFNRRSGVSFTDSYSTALADAVGTFQSFMLLDVTRSADFPTWAALLVSYGDNTRKGTAYDCASTVTAARAKTLYDNGYRIAGRYLTNVPGTTLDKKIKPGELETIANAGMSCFPIYQTYGDSSSYFSRAQGTSDAVAAVNAAHGHGFKKGTRIYFAVDYDNTDEEITAHLIPHFRGINEGMEQTGNLYKVGIYATRNACSRVAAEGLSGASFVSNMSAGFSGNLGFPMPEDWAIDQISTVTIGSGDGAIEIDNDIASGRESGQSTFDPPPADNGLDVAFDFAWKDIFIADLRQAMEAQGLPESAEGRQFTNTEAIKYVLYWDDLITSMARMLRMRKALIQVPLLWEFRHYQNGEDLDKNDDFSDACVTWYYTEELPTIAEWANNIQAIDDSSTGVAQIFGHRAIDARNYAIDLGLLNEAKRNPNDRVAGDPTSDVYVIWKKLRENASYNISTIPYMHILASKEYDLPRPGLSDTAETILRFLVHYQGTGDMAESMGRKRYEFYKLIEEKYNSVFRSVAG